MFYAITLPLRLAHLIRLSLTFGPSLELLPLSLQVHVSGLVGEAAHQTLEPLVPLGLVGDVLLLVGEERFSISAEWNTALESILVLVFSVLVLVFSILVLAFSVLVFSILVLVFSILVLVFSILVLVFSILVLVFSICQSSG